MGRRLSAVENLVTGANPDPGFWRGKRVLLTGHTGFKGAWTALWLKRLGAVVHGLALAPDTSPSLWELTGEGVLEAEAIVDVDDRDGVARAVAEARAEIVIHMAAQALVRRSYRDPVGTYAANLMGTVHLLEALRASQDVKAILVVTTDKVYANNDLGRNFVEDDPLGGHDPYSASKAAAELAVASYAASYFDKASVPLATARAGNVIGGGDWAEDRLIPDVWRAAAAGVPLKLRNPGATRPWQHVIEAACGYLLYIEALTGNPETPRALNFGPLPGHAATVAEVAEEMAKALGSGALWEQDAAPGPKEMTLLSLDPARAISALGWRPRLESREAVAWSARWYGDYGAGRSARDLCDEQIADYEALA